MVLSIEVVHGTKVVWLKCPDRKDYAYIGADGSNSGASRFRWSRERARPRGIIEWFRRWLYILLVVFCCCSSFVIVVVVVLLLLLFQLRLWFSPIVAEVVH